MIRQAAIGAKFSWLLAILTPIQVPQECPAKIQRIMEARNEFVHYKWGEVREDEEERLAAIVEMAEEVVEQLQGLLDEQQTDVEIERIRRLIGGP
jgi:nitrate/TMAO reductase-like tetraheme cytochrome c subunit